jgi:hypothetical protein
MPFAASTPRFSDDVNANLGAVGLHENTALEATVAARRRTAVLVFIGGIFTRIWPFASPVL